MLWCQWSKLIEQTEISCLVRILKPMRIKYQKKKVVLLGMHCMPHLLSCQIEPGGLFSNFTANQPLEIVFGTKSHAKIKQNVCASLFVSQCLCLSVCVCSFITFLGGGVVLCPQHSTMFANRLTPCQCTPPFVCPNQHHPSIYLNQFCPFMFQCVL